MRYHQHLLALSIVIACCGQSYGQVAVNNTNARDVMQATSLESVASEKTSIIAELSRTPNFVVILADDQGWNSLSTRMDPDDSGSGSTYYQTPNLDRLAVAGMRFSQAYSPAPTCSPSRHAIQFGRSPTSLKIFGADKIGVWDAKSRDSLANSLKRINSNYRCAHLGKWHIGKPPAELGFDVHDGKTSNQAGNSKDKDDPKLIYDLSRRSIEFINDQVEADKPFFLQISHYANHLEFQAKQETVKEFETDHVGNATEYQNSPLWAAMNKNLDEGIGMVLDRIEELGIADNTYIIYTADNGYELKEDAGKPVHERGFYKAFPQRSHKYHLSEGGIRVPFIVRGPGVPAGSHSKTAVVGTDIFATVLDLAGGAEQIPAAVEGGSLVAHLKSGGKDQVQRKDPFLVFKYSKETVPHDIAIVQDSFKLIKDINTGRTFLFNLDKDIGERQDLAESEPQRASEMYSAMTKYFARFGWDESQIKSKRGQKLKKKKKAKKKSDEKNQTNKAGNKTSQTNEKYHEIHRPQFHFTADEGWINDPNGLVYVDGVYHLFFQHERRFWGHATSTDLLHWQQLTDAVKDPDGHAAFSGSAVIDQNNTSGFQTGSSSPIVAVFTSWGEGQCLGYSNDNGKTWERYKDNPVLKLPGDELKSWQMSARDPHVMWDNANGRWVMVLYANPKQLTNKEGSGFSIFTSLDLKQWKKQSHLAGFYVCPDVFQLPIEGENNQASWVAMDWEKYTTGEFDGKTFLPKPETRKLDFGKSLSANQSWKHLPDGRVIQICWLSGGKYPGMPFDQQLSFPTELSLRRIGDDLVLCKNPIRELDKLHRSRKALAAKTLAEGESSQFDDLSQSLDIEASFVLPADGQLVFNVLGQDIQVTRNEIQCMESKGQLPGNPEKQTLRILADRTSIEIFANDGSLTMAFCLIPDKPVGHVLVTAVKGDIVFTECEVREVGSIWPKNGELQKNGTKNEEKNDVVLDGVR